MITAPLRNAASAPTRPWLHRRGAPWPLVGAALGSGLIYALYLTLIAFLPRHLAVADIYLFGILGTSWGSLALYAVAVGTLFGLAGIAWRVTCDARGTDVVLWALVPPVVFALLLLLTQPLTSRDIFYYIMEGRVLGVHGANPYLQPPAAFPTDPLFPYSNWDNYTSPYGPIWLLISAALARLAGGSLFWNVYLLKIVAFCGYCACAALVWAILRALGRPALPGTVFWLWNPLVLLEFPGAAHNDVLMLAGILGALWLYLTGRLRAAFAVFTLAALVKSVALALLPLALWHYLAPLPTWRARGREALRLLWVPALLVAALLGPFWAGGNTFGPVEESYHYYSSIAHIVRIGLQFGISPRLAGRIVHNSVLLVLGLGYLLILRRIPGTREALLVAATRAMLLLIVVWPFFVPWYCAWAVALVAARGARRLGWRVLILCLGGTLSYLSQIFLPARTRSTVGVSSTLAALIIFVPFALSLYPWVAPAVADWVGNQLAGGRAGNVQA